MPEASIRFYAQLNDFLAPSQRGVRFRHPIAGHVSIKDLIESVGVPHPEVELILVNGRAVDFTYLVARGDDISVYPVFHTLQLPAPVPLRPGLPDPARFVLDTHLGRLAAYLRLLGFDTLYRNNYDDPELATVSSDEGRILLTRDRGLLKRREVVHGYCLRSTDSRHQLIELLRRYDLFDAVAPFSRCVHCNGRLHAVPKAEVEDRLLPQTRAHYDAFQRCAGCGQVYWHGSHGPALLQLLAAVRAAAEGRG